MLVNLKIEHFALIDHLDLSLNDSFISLIGETGAGKSILIDALSLLSGSRADLNKIRNGEDFSSVEGTFLVNSQCKNNLESSLGFKIGSSITIYRYISRNGKNIVKINDKILPLNVLKEISTNLIDIHSQQKDADYLHQENQLKLLDDYIFYNASNEEKEAFKEYCELYLEYINLNKELKKIEQKNSSLGDIESLENELNYLDSLNIVSHEMEDLEEERRELSSLSSSLDQVKEFIHLYEGVKDDLYRLKKLVTKIHDCDQERFENSYYEMDDIYHTILDINDSFYEKEKRLEIVKERLFTLHSLRKKYGYTTEDILDSINNLKLDLEDVKSYQYRHEDLENKLFKLRPKLQKSAELLTKIRNKYGEQLSKDITLSMLDLNFINAEFKVNIVSSDDYLDHGIDEVTFLLRANIGEKFLPLDKTSSLGESSRLNFALKYVFNKLSPKDLIIFDEIDVGVSGRVGISLAKKMKELSLNSQIIVISHLPSLVALSNVTYKVEKHNDEKRTYTLVKKIDRKEKIEALAIMISGSINNESLLAAEKLLSN